MRKIMVVGVLAAAALTGCAASQAAPAGMPSTPATTSPHWVTKDGQPFDPAAVKFNESAVPSFATAAASIPGYRTASTATLTVIARDLCEHYAGGFNTEDLRAGSVSGKESGEALARLGEAAKATVCA
ncbi:hypothetical protein ACIPY3_02670 [Paenarthrobacter sp. NPDC089714]|uniref:hypothetical protein n=1 Tax=Paenarthrobacter sp. NPDC089714 TaxID=3364377 RepID=UPI00382AD90E